jgi:hypothetical protein
MFTLWPGAGKMTQRESGVKVARCRCNCIGWTLIISACGAMVLRLLR